ncbi:unnamed protein product [Didymodactylos carnosus]|uniref:PHD finger protein 14 n=1 Tax=Didymodactylos carnosus TaxID=1234261 RepID=A0A813XPS8_9BILA|nr:unnamed protein product [Didymodactylos carnosus]CAF3658517.1 unnamed protein product [Didymodactylos carnosus]
MLIPETKICSICLGDGSTDDSDPIVFCDHCGLIVHESCYNADTLDDKSSDSSSPSEYWFCSPCLAQIDDPICALCPERGGAFWPTLESSWCHVVCAMTVPNVLLYEEIYYTPVDLSNIPPQKFGNKPCKLCENASYARTGVTVQCDAGLCPNSFHVSCANKNGFLQIHGDITKHECEIYCQNHQSSELYKQVKRNYTMMDIQQKQLDKRNATDIDDEMLNALAEHRPLFKKRLTTFPRLPKPTKSHVARSLMADPIALKAFYEKDVRLKHKHTASATSANGVHGEEDDIDLTSTNTNPLIAFPANEEELRQIRLKIDETEKRLAELENDTVDSELLAEQAALQTEYNDQRQTYETTFSRYKKLQEVLKLYDCQLPLFTPSTHDQNGSVLQTNTTSASTTHAARSRLADSGPSVKGRQKSSSSTTTKEDMMLLPSKDDSQCAECVDKQEKLKDIDVDVNQPRKTRPRKTNELVLREGVNKGQFDEKFPSKRSSLHPTTKPRSETTTEPNVDETMDDNTSNTQNVEKPTLPSTSRKRALSVQQSSSDKKSRTKRLKTIDDKSTTISAPAVESKEAKDYDPFETALSSDDDENTLYTMGPASAAVENDNEKKTRTVSSTSSAVTEIVNGEYDYLPHVTLNGDESNDVQEQKPLKSTTTPPPNRAMLIKQLFTRKNSTTTPERKSVIEPGSSKSTSSSAAKEKKSAKKRVSKVNATKTVSVDSPKKSKQQRKSLNASATSIPSSVKDVPKANSTVKQQNLTPTGKSKKNSGTKQNRAMAAENSKLSDPMSIFDFFDEDDGEVIELRSSTSQPSHTTAESSSTFSTSIKKEPLEKSSTTPRSRGRRTRKSVFEPPIGAVCRECEQKGANENMTDCDECKNYYHFQCCTPPLTAYPKTRGYGWSCHRCSVMNESSKEDSPQSSTMKTGKRERKSRYANQNEYVLEEA